MNNSSNNAADSQGSPAQLLPKCFREQPDAIDFPSSPDWVRHYAGQGLTTDYPPQFYLARACTLRHGEIGEAIDQPPETVLDFPCSLTFREYDLFDLGLRPVEGVEFENY